MRAIRLCALFGSWHIARFSDAAHLHTRGGEFVLCMDNDGIELVFAESRAFYTCFKRAQLDAMFSLWCEKEYQGRVARTENVDRRLSSSYLTNPKLSDVLVKFVAKARVQLTETNSQLHLYYPGDYPRSCDRCGFHSDTLSHVLNGCQESRNAIQSRHNRIMNILAKTVREINTSCAISVDSTVKPEMFNSDERAFPGIQHNKPDICVIDHDRKICFLIEIAVPFDPFVNESYQAKFDTYLPLCQRIGDLAYECKIVVLIVGSLGSVHNRFVSGLLLLGLTKRCATSTARYCSVSSMIGSRMIWRQRCHAILP